MIEDPKKRIANGNGILVYDSNANAVVKIVNAKPTIVSYNTISVLLDFWASSLVWTGFSPHMVSIWAVWIYLYSDLESDEAAFALLL